MTRRRPATLRALKRRIDDARRRINAADSLERFAVEITRSVDARRNRDADTVVRVLEATFRRDLVEVPAPIVRAFVDGVAELSRADVHGDVTDAITNAVAQAEPIHLDIATWLALRGLAIRHGLFAASNAFRTRAVAVARTEAADPAADPRTLATGVRAAVDDARLDEAFELRSRISDREESNIWLGGVDELLRILDPDASRAVTADWGGLLNGRSVAIAGPAPSGEKAGVRIDDHDLVVRIEYRGAEHLPDATEAGARTDVSYYNAQGGRALVHRKLDHVLRELRMAVFKRHDHVVIAPPGHGRGAHTPRDVFIAGTPNMLPIMLFDLLVTGAAPPSIFHANFFHADAPYHPGYRDGMVDQRGNIAPVDEWMSRGRMLEKCREMSRHDPLSQLHFVRNLWRAGLVRPDDACAAVLGMDDDDYLAGIDRFWGRPAR